MYSIDKHNNYDLWELVRIALKQNCTRGLNFMKTKLHKASILYKETFVRRQCCTNVQFCKSNMEGHFCTRVKKTKG